MQTKKGGAILVNCDNRNWVGMTEWQSMSGRKGYHQWQIQLLPLLNVGLSFLFFHNIIN